MTYRKKVDAQHAHISSLRGIIGLLVILGLYMAYGWQSAPRDLTVHVPPDLRSGSTRQWWDVPPESVYTFGFYIFQQINRWPRDGEADYEANISRLESFLSPSCKNYLQTDFELRRNSGELRARERGVSEIPGRGLNDTSVQRVKQHSINDWTVNLDIITDEHYGGEIVKRAFVRYPLHVMRSDVDPELNPFGLTWDCYSGNPQRIEAPAELPKPGGKL